MSRGVSLPESCDLVALGLDPAGLENVYPMSDRHGHHLLRLRHSGRCYVLKHYPRADESTEIRAYRLLIELGVPTIPVQALTENSLLIADLDESEEWRLAMPDDVGQIQVGRAVARWYRLLHKAGSAWLAAINPRPDWLLAEFDVLTPEGLIDVGNRLELGEACLWRRAAAAIEALLGAVRSLAQTLTYNDFHYTNLAMSRGDGPTRAIVFDHHLLGAGLAFSDCRNVVGSLGPLAAEAFSAEYGLLDPLQALLDEPFSHLHALWEATRRESFPTWAAPSLAMARDGRLLASLDRAIEVVSAR
jgi:hypothetical protein